MRTFTNPVIFADVPDPDVIYDGRYYYMVSTTMYFAPSVPLMRSADLVHWSIVGYTSPILEDVDALALRNGGSAYGQGTWAASMRFHDGVYYVSVASLTTQRTYIYSTTSIEEGPWTRSVLEGYAHDQSILFDGDDAYLVYGAGVIDLRRLTRADDGTFAWDGPVVRLVDDASIDPDRHLRAEGAHAYKIGDYYYVFMIEWPANGLRQEIVWRSTSLTPLAEGGDWEGRVVLCQSSETAGRPGTGVAQGGVVQAADGQWYAMLFQDEGPLGRSPHLAQVTWCANGWPRFTLERDTAAPRGDAADLTGIVASDEFEGRTVKAGYWNSTNAHPITASSENAWNGSNLGLQWQWNHNPDNRLWSLTARHSHLRLTAGSISSSIIDARNTLTQRVVGPASSATISLDVSRLNDGDVCGLAVSQQKFGFVGVTMDNGVKSVAMRRADAGGNVTFTSPPVPLTVDVVLLRAHADFRDGVDSASFTFSLDGTTWTPIGDTLAMEYSLDHFTGYRFAIFYYATVTTGGSVDVDWFRVSRELLTTAEHTGESAMR